LQAKVARIGRDRRARRSGPRREEHAEGSSHTCALTAVGAVLCWGANESGQLGDATTLNRQTPGPAVGLPAGAQALSAGDAHTCALIGGHIMCWGGNNGGQLGNGIPIARPIPRAVTGLASGVSVVAAHDSRTCAVTATGGAQCWGLNAGPGVGWPDRWAPEAVQGLPSRRFRGIAMAVVERAVGDVTVLDLRSDSGGRLAPPWAPALATDGRASWRRRRRQVPRAVSACQGRHPQESLPRKVWW
jgi:hypothetical protein